MSAQQRPIHHIHTLMHKCNVICRSLRGSLRVRRPGRGRPPHPLGRGERHSHRRQREDGGVGDAPRGHSKARPDVARERILSEARGESCRGGGRTPHPSGRSGFSGTLARARRLLLLAGTISSSLRQVMHLPGHSPGSIALHDAAAGVVATGDTVYETDGEGGPLQRPFSNFFTFILGSPFLLPMRLGGFQCLGHSNWTICSPLSPFCSEIFPTFSLSYWGANSYYPRGLIMGDYCTPPRGTMEIMLPEGHIMPPEGCIILPEGLCRPEVEEARGQDNAPRGWHNVA